ncbi:hypothetical protein D3C86_1400230 [compost metagenome]
MEFGGGTRDKRLQIDAGVLHQRRIGQALQPHAERLQQFRRQAGQESIAFGAEFEIYIAAAEIAKIDLDVDRILPRSKVCAVSQCIQGQRTRIAGVAWALVHEPGLKPGARNGVRGLDFQ